MELGRRPSEAECRQSSTWNALNGKVRTYKKQLARGGAEHDREISSPGDSCSAAGTKCDEYQTKVRLVCVVAAAAEPSVRSAYVRLTFGCAQLAVWMALFVEEHGRPPSEAECRQSSTWSALTKKVRAYRKLVAYGRGAEHRTEHRARRAERDVRRAAPSRRDASSMARRRRRAPPRKRNEPYESYSESDEPYEATPMAPESQRLVSTPTPEPAATPLPPLPSPAIAPVLAKPVANLPAPPLAPPPDATGAWHLTWRESHAGPVHSVAYRSALVAEHRSAPVSEQPSPLSPATVNRLVAMPTPAPRATAAPATSTSIVSHRAPELPWWKLMPEGCCAARRSPAKRPDSEPFGTPVLAQLLDRYQSWLAGERPGPRYESPRPWLR